MTISATDILAVTKSVTKKWTKQRKAEERGRRSRSSRQYVYSSRVDFTEVAHDILPAAYLHASGNEKFTVPQRQLYYACRDHFFKRTGRRLTSSYFSGKLLVIYRNEHPETESWKVTADPRGALSIPNAGYEVRIPCGTIQIGNHLRDASRAIDPFDIDGTLRTEWPSLAEGQRYQAVLYIEKAGFDPMMGEAKIAERFDIATLSCQGQSVVAARRLADHACRVGGGVPLFIVHDFDKSGFEISKCLTSVSERAEEAGLVRYRFQNEINFTDLGLRLDDVKKYDMADEECKFRGYFQSDSICTDEEKEFLRSRRRVELNAFTAPQFIEWIEGKLTEHGLGDRRIPDDAILADAYRRALAIAKINAATEKARESAIADAKIAEIPANLRDMVREEMKGSSAAWDKTLYGMAESKVSSDDEV